MYKVSLGWFEMVDMAKILFWRKCEFWMLTIYGNYIAQKNLSKNVLFS